MSKYNLLYDTVHDGSQGITTYAWNKHIHTCARCAALNHHITTLEAQHANAARSNVVLMDLVADLTFQLRGEPQEWLTRAEQITQANDRAVTFMFSSAMGDVTTRLERTELRASEAEAKLYALHTILTAVETEMLPTWAEYTSTVRKLREVLQKGEEHGAGR